MKQKQFPDFKNQFQWFIGFGILFLVLDALMLNKDKMDTKAQFV
ncbi:MAG: hypothetical protein R2821_01790 [Flavobacteriaceae bacterium]